MPDVKYIGKSKKAGNSKEIPGYDVKSAGGGRLNRSAKPPRATGKMDFHDKQAIRDFRTSEAYKKRNPKKSTKAGM